jgi:hypothetical protein
MAFADYFPESKITFEGGVEKREKIPAKKNIADDIKNLVSSILKPRQSETLNVLPNSTASAVPEIVAIPKAVLPDPEQQVRQMPVQTPPSTTARNPAVSKFTIPENVHSAINKASTEFGIPASLLYDIALQESSFDPTLRNSQPGSTAAGLFQFTDGTWDTVNNYANMEGSSLSNWNNPDKMDANASARAAAYLIKNGQLGRWNASQGVWGPQYSRDELNSYYSQTGEDEIPVDNWKL